MLRYLSFLSLTFAIIAMSGCDYARSRVHGKITLNGKPVVNCTVMFMTRDNQVYRAEVQPDGTYSIDGVPQGPVSVSIQQALPFVPPRADPDPRKGGVGEAKDKDRDRDPPASAMKPITNPLPGKYTDPKQSGLTFELKGAEQEWSIDLK